MLLYIMDFQEDRLTLELFRQNYSRKWIAQLNGP